MTTYQRISTPDRDYLLPTIQTLIEDKTAGRPSVIRVEQPKIVDNREVLK